MSAHRETDRTEETETSVIVHRETDRIEETEIMEAARRETDRTEGAEISEAVRRETDRTEETEAIRKDVREDLRMTEISHMAVSQETDRTGGMTETAEITETEITERILLLSRHRLWKARSRREVRVKAKMIIRRRISVMMRIE